eukprot:m.76400 g.76400  ORF g.76400 m.76400 type:complete len:921 (+) comp7870_c1_seq1:54-2816(+)
MASSAAAEQAAIMESSMDAVGLPDAAPAMPSPKKSMLKNPQSPIVAAGAGEVSGEGATQPVIKPPTRPPQRAHGRDRRRRRGEMDEFHMAAYSMLDGLQGRDKHGLMSLIKRPTWIQYAFHFQTSDLEAWGFLIAVAVHCLAGYFEQSNAALGLALAAPCLVVFVLDILAKMAYMTPSDCLNKPWNFVQMLFTVFFLIDYILLATGRVQPFRLLRPWLILCRDRELRRVFQAVLSMHQTIFKMVALVSALIFLFASMAVHVFASDYHTDVTYDPSQDDVNYEGAFDDVLKGSLYLFILTTTQNFPAVMMPAYRQSSASIIFFNGFLIIGIFYLVPMFTAIIMDAFWKATARQVKKDRRKERKKLVEAFNYMDPDGDGMIEPQQWLSLMKVVRPELPREAHELLFRQLDKNSDGVIDILDWLDVGEVLKFHVASVDTGDIVRRWPASLQPFIGRLKALTDSRQYEPAIAALIVTYWVFFCAEYYDMPSSTAYGLNGVRLAIFSVLFADIVIRILCRGWQFERNYLFLGIQIKYLEIVTVTLMTISTGLWWSGRCHVGFCSIIGDVPHAFRVLYKVRRAESLMRIFNMILPLGVMLIVLMAMVIYSYSVIGLTAFAGIYFPEPAYCATGANGEADAGDSNFGTLFCSTLVVFQAMTDANWHVLIDQVLQEVTSWSALYFFTFYVIVRFVILSIMVGVYVDAFHKISRKKKSSEPKPGSVAPEAGAPAGKGEEGAEMDGTIGQMLEGGFKADAVVDILELEKKRQINSRPREYGVAIESALAKRPRDLAIRKGDLIEVLDRDGRFVKGELAGKTGWVDVRMIVMVNSAPPATILGLASSVPTSHDKTTAPQSNNLAPPKAKSNFIVENNALKSRDVVNITALNADELHELNAIARADMLGRGRSKSTATRPKAGPKLAQVSEE